MSQLNVCYAIHYKGELANNVLRSAKIFYEKESTAKSACTCSVNLFNKYVKYYKDKNIIIGDYLDINDFSIVKYVPEGE